MKVILIGPAFPLRGGIADFNEALATSLLEQNIDTVIYSFYYQYPKILFPGTSQFTEGKGPEKLKINSTISSINPYSWWKTAKAIAAEKPDLVVIRYWLPFMAPALGTIAKYLKKKKISIIAIADNVIPHEKRTGDKQFTQYFVNQCKGFITMSKEVERQLSQFTPTNKKICLPHPIYNIFGTRIPKKEARVTLNLPIEERIVLFFGFIRAYKGLGLLLEAMADPQVRGRKIKLVVAGEFYEDNKPYLEQIKSLGISGSIILHTSFIEKEKVRVYFCAADMIIQPYMSATQSGITQIAYYFGRPMLVTNVGGLSEIVADKRVGYVTEKNSASIVKSLIDFYDNNREKDFSNNVDIDKEKFSWKSFTNGLLKLYDEIR